MKIANVQEEIKTPNYVSGLLKTVGRKVCTNLSATLGVSHDSLNREIENAAENVTSISKPLYQLANKHVSGKEKYLIIDDMPNAKEHAKEIEGLDLVFDTVQHRAVVGLLSVIAIITDKIAKIPVDAEIMISKTFAGSAYKSKSEIAQVIIDRLLGSVLFDWFLADAHYATQFLIGALCKRSIQFLMKINRNRVVIIGGEQGQLQNILRLKKNNRVASAQGTFGGISCYFYVLKVAPDKTMYLVSNVQICKERLVGLYKVRWTIECFNRTAKQLLGFSECQMRSFKMQHAHLLYILWAYAIADINRIKCGFLNVEQSIRSYRIAKPVTLNSSIFALGDNLNAIA